MKLFYFSKFIKKSPSRGHILQLTKQRIGRSSFIRDTHLKQNKSTF